MEKTERAHVDFSLIWESPHARHEDRYAFLHLNFWRDILPHGFEDHLRRMSEGEVKEEAFGAGTLVPAHSEKNILALEQRQIRFPSGSDAPGELTTGRFYPRGWLVTSFTVAEETRPFRYLGKKGTTFLVDLNHPLARFPMTLRARLVERLGPREERGGRCNDVLYTLMEDGPGLQAALPDQDTEFFSRVPLERSDQSEDRLFYEKERFVNHVDETAMEVIQSTYARFLKPGMKVLDLMSSWDSHLPKDLKDLSVTGLGLNRQELEGNPALDASVIHDLNRESRLPFGDREFDAALCSLSVEYMMDPVSVFGEVSRVLKPGAPFVVTFSNRWFPPKVIKLWTDLHLFERAGFVLECFRKSGGFGQLNTESLRGLPRPRDDKYFPESWESDPVFAVWGEAL